MRSIWLGVISALGAALLPVVAWACAGPPGETFTLRLESVTVAGQPAADLQAYAGFDVTIEAGWDGGLIWTAYGEGGVSYHAVYDR